MAQATGATSQRSTKPMTAPRVRDAEATQRRILIAAKKEFAKHGLGGARVDQIAASARANKRMIYHYFGSKEALFAAVLEDAYANIRAAERALNLQQLEPEPALDQLIEFTWNYYLQNPEFLTLVNSENLHRARHIKKSTEIRNIHRPFGELIEQILDKGVKKGVFRKGIDPTQLAITIAAIGYYYLTNRFTGSVIYGREFMTETALAERLEFNLTTIRRLVRKM